MTETGHTYVGATTDPDRRLEQHNGKRSGGARATAIQVIRGEQWRRVCIISGIPEWRSALQIEWRWKQLSRKEKSKIPLHRRLRALHHLLSLEKPTQQSIPYDAYPDGPPIIQWDSENDAIWYSQLTNQNTGATMTELNGILER